MTIREIIKKSKYSVVFDAISVEGSLFSGEILTKAAHRNLDFQNEMDYLIPKGLNLRDEIGRYFRIALGLWDDLKVHNQTEKFAVSLLNQCFGFDDLRISESGVSLQGKTFCISAFTSGRSPIVISTKDDGLDFASNKFQIEGRKRTAFGLLQEYLNASPDSLWGICTDGNYLRLVRDNSSLTKPAWVEADLSRIFQENLYSDFAALWLLVHRSRFNKKNVPADECVLEKWREKSKTEGVRAQEKLRSGVESALETLGQGFLVHNKNLKLQDSLRGGNLSLHDFHLQLLRLVYKFIFLLTIEERDLLHPTGTEEKVKALYLDGYSLRKLRDKSVKKNLYDRYYDLWEVFKITSKSLRSGEPKLGLPALGGLFSDQQTPVLDVCSIDNRFLLAAIFSLTWIKEEGGISRINWRDMGPEELGSVYEGLLELVPQIKNGGTVFTFATGDETRGNSRKSTGSYYTPDSLVQSILDTALEPVILETISKNPENPVGALLDLSIIDPACGSGHFLLAAARRMAVHVAKLQVDGTPTIKDYRDALRKVISKTIYGVDKNSMAIELARTALWLESMTPDFPLSFLDHHLICGDSLLGLMDLEILKNGIPSDAYKASTFDDIDLCRKLSAVNSQLLKKIKKEDSSTQLRLDIPMTEAVSRLRMIENMPDNLPNEVEKKQIAMENFLAASGSMNFHPIKVAADLFVAAFLIPKNKVTEKLVPTTNDVLSALRGALPELDMVSYATKLAEESNMLHWKIKFPHVFSNGGFSVMIGNPPWERVKLQKEEFFASRSPEIARAKNANERRKLIESTAITNPTLFNEWQNSLRAAEIEIKFYGKSGRFPLGGVGDVNTYAVFADHFRQAISAKGMAGLILPNGLVTGFTYRTFLKTLLNTKTLCSFFGFENEDKIFPDVHNETKFGLLTLSGLDRKIDRPWFTAHIRQVNQINEIGRKYSLSVDEIEAINPNTLNLPAFRWQRDAEVAAAIHTNSNVLIRKRDKNDIDNSWMIKFKSLFHMSGDSGKFIDHADVRSKISTYENSLAVLEDGTRLYPLFEGKMMWHFDHRYGTYEGQSIKQANKKVLPHVSDINHNNPNFRIEPKYWVSEGDVASELGDDNSRNYYFSWRDVGPTERTFVGTIIPKGGAGHKAPILISDLSPRKFTSLCIILSSLVVDYDARQRSNQMALFVIEQLAIPHPERIEEDLPWLGMTVEDFLIMRGIELYYTSYELEPLARDLGYNCSPFKWDSNRRLLIQCEIDALIMHIYKLTRVQAEWLLDTFSVLKKYEEKEHKEFRTKNLVLSSFDYMENAKKTYTRYVSSVDPLPGSISQCHQTKHKSKILKIKS